MKMKNVMKQCLVAIVVMCLCLSLYPMTIAKADGDNTPMKIITTIDEDPFVAGSGTEKDPYVINSADGLVIFRKKVESGENYTKKFIKLGADIDLGKYCGRGKGDWDPIGVYEGKSFDDRVFNGTFDGAGHTISGLYVANGTWGEGLFAKIETSATIKNLTVKGSMICNDNVVGGIVGHYPASSIIDNCVFSGTVKGKTNVGGIAGFGSGTISNCKAEGQVSGKSIVGGVAGNPLGNASSCTSSATVNGTSKIGGVFGASGGRDYKNTICDCSYDGDGVSGSTEVGGIMGLNNSKEVKNCESFGSVTCYNDQVGGIAGGSGGPINECKNYGNVVSLGAKAGGIAGWAFSCGDTYGTVLKCSNSGNVAAKDGEVGGIVGLAYHTVTDCKNYGKVTSESGKDYGDIVGQVAQGDKIENIVKYTEEIYVHPQIEKDSGFNHLDLQKQNQLNGGLVGSSFGEGNWVMIVVLSGVAVLALAGGAFFLVRRKKTSKSGV